MSAAAKTAIDKSSWGEGPWQGEPDRLQWQCAGYACLIVRRDRLGHWCGYVGVDSAHPLYGKPYADASSEIEVHGGLTYSDKCSGPICHVPEPGFPDEVWWFGFDCAHLGDFSPGLIAIERELNLLPLFGKNLVFDRPSVAYRDLAYVRAETESLATQLRGLCPLRNSA